MKNLIYLDNNATTQMDKRVLGVHLNVGQTSHERANVWC